MIKIIYIGVSVLILFYAIYISFEVWQKFNYLDKSLQEVNKVQPKTDSLGYEINKADDEPNSK